MELVPAADEAEENEADEEEGLVGSDKGEGEHGVDASFKFP